MVRREPRSPASRTDADRRNLDGSRPRRRRASAAPAARVYAGSGGAGGRSRCQSVVAWSASPTRSRNWSRFRAATNCSPTGQPVIGDAHRHGEGGERGEDAAVEERGVAAGRRDRHEAPVQRRRGDRRREAHDQVDLVEQRIEGRHRPLPFVERPQVLDRRAPRAPPAIRSAPRDRPRSPAAPIAGRARSCRRSPEPRSSAATGGSRGRPGSSARRTPARGRGAPARRRGAGPERVARRPPRRRPRGRRPGGLGGRRRRARRPAPGRPRWRSRRGPGGSPRRCAPSARSARASASLQAARARHGVERRPQPGDPAVRRRHRDRTT